MRTLKRTTAGKISLVLTSITLLSAQAAVGQPQGEILRVDTGDAFCGEADRNLQQPYRCAEVVVGCPPAENRPVQLRITTPPSGTPIVGTVVFGLGGSGRGFYESAKRNADPDLPAAEMLDRLNLAGYRVIQRSWRDRPNDDPGGWINGSTSLRTSACRYATLMGWIYDQAPLHDPSSQAFCAVGQSGGGSEIAYGLATYGLENLIDMAVLTGGPPHGRIDGGCDATSMAWEQTCNANLETLGICPEQGPDRHACFFSEQSIERNVDAAFDLRTPPDDEPCAGVDTPTLIANGVLSPIADLDHPLTHVAFLIGERDCNTAPSMGSSYILALLGNSTGPANFAVLPGVSHTVPAFDDGAAAIEAALTASDGCILRHAPAQNEAGH